MSRLSRIHPGKHIILARGRPNHIPKKGFEPSAVHAPSDHANPYQAPQSLDVQVPPRLTQRQIDHEHTVELEIPEVIHLQLEIPSIAKDGHRIRVAKVLPDGGTVIANISVVPDDAEHHPSVKLCQKMKPKPFVKPATGMSKRTKTSDANAVVGRFDASR